MTDHFGQLATAVFWKHFILKSLYLALALLAPDGRVPLGRSVTISVKFCMVSGWLRYKMAKNIAENFNRLSRAHERYRRQSGTDRRISDSIYENDTYHVQVIKPNYNASSTSCCFRQPHCMRHLLPKAVHNRQLLQLPSATSQRFGLPVRWLLHWLMKNRMVIGWFFLWCSCSLYK